MISQALEDESGVEAMQEELLQFKLQKVWILVDLQFGKKAIGTKQEEGIDYDEVFAPVARIEAIRLFLAFASFMGFPVYQIDVKSAFIYGTIEEEVYVHQPLGFVDPAYPNKVYKVIKALYGLHQAPRAWYETLSSLCLKNILDLHESMCTVLKNCMHKTIPDELHADILKKFDFCSIKTATTPIASNKPLVKDEDGVDVDVHVYRSMISSLMYLTASRPDIMFAVCACARFQVTPKALHLNAVKRIFRYLKHQPNLGLWYPRDSPFELEAFSDSDYGGASLDRKSTTGGCQFLGRGLISWQCKKQTIVVNSTTEEEYVAAANCYGNFVLLVQKLILLGLVCAAQKYFTMEMMFGLGNKMLLGLNQNVEKSAAKALPPQGMVKRVEKYIMNKRFGNQESVSKKGRKKSKPESTLDDNTSFDDQGADHGMEYMETEEAMDEGRQSGETEEVKLTDDTEVVEDKSSGDKEGNAEELVSTARPEVSTARPELMCWAREVLLSLEILLTTISYL
ncbi:putative ribonuclease H-like domain-containing protein [Tanacetum coccineum]